MEEGVTAAAGKVAAVTTATAATAATEEEEREERPRLCSLNRSPYRPNSPLLAPL